MLKMKKRFGEPGIFGFLLAVSFMLTGVVMAYAELPYTFKSGDPAMASEVNANFTHVNFGNIIVNDNDGTEIGTLIYSTWDGGVTVLTASGHIVRFGFDGTPVGYILWDGINCSGNPYLAETDFGTAPSPQHVHSDGLNYYVPDGTAATSVTVYSRTRNTGCSNEESPWSAFAYPASIASGIGGPFTGPLSIERR